MKPSDAVLRPKLTPRIENQLENIEPSLWDGAKYYPCSATLNDGTKLDCMYLVAQYSYMKTWGRYPAQEIPLENVVRIENSPFRLPAKIATELYAAGESSMGGVYFTLEFSDGSRQAYGSGNAIDFVSYPDGKSGSDIIGLLPHVGRDANPIHGPKYSVCLYCDADTERVFPVGLTRPRESEQPPWWKKGRPGFLA